MRMYKVTAPDNPEGTLYELAPTHIEVAINRRLSEGRPVPVVLCPDSPDCFIFNPGNFWDGPTHVYYQEGLGMFYFESWGGKQHFPLIGPLQ